MGERVGELAKPLDKVVDGLRALLRKISLTEAPHVRELVDELVFFDRGSLLPTRNKNPNQTIIPHLADERAIKEMIRH